MKQIYTAEKRVSLFINKNQVALQGQKLAFQVEDRRREGSHWENVQCGIFFQCVLDHFAECEM